MKAVYSTGEAAEACNVSQQTIIRCFDAGKLKGFRVPGSRFRRIPHDALIAFIKENGIPAEGLSHGERKILIIDEDEDQLIFLADKLHQYNFLVKTATSGYEGGILTAEFKPNIIIADNNTPDVHDISLCSAIRKKWADTKIIITGTPPAAIDIETIMHVGGTAFIKKSYSFDFLLEKIEELLKVAVPV